MSNFFKQAPQLRNASRDLAELGKLVTGPGMELAKGACAREVAHQNSSSMACS